MRRIVRNQSRRFSRPRPMEPWVPMSTSDAPAERPASEADGVGGYPWWACVWAVAAVAAIATSLRSHAVDIPLRDPDGRLFSDRIATTAAFVVVMAVAQLLVCAVRSAHGFRAGLSEA